MGKGLRSKIIIPTGKDQSMRYMYVNEVVSLPEIRHGALSMLKSSMPQMGYKVELAE